MKGEEMKGEEIKGKSNPNCSLFTVHYSPIFVSRETKRFM